MPPLSSLPPLMLMLVLSMGVIAWQHVVGHSYTTAQSMHIGPIILLSSISTCNGIIGFFVNMSLVSIARYVGAMVNRLRGGGSTKANASTFEFYNNDSEHDNITISPQGSPRTISLAKDSPDRQQQQQYHSGAPTAPQRCAAADRPIDDEDSDIDAAAFRNTTASMQQCKGDSAATTSPLQGLIFQGDILTVTMVYTNVYGLGLACFFLGYVLTMASTLATFTFIVGASCVAVYEFVQERRFPMQRQWHLGRSTGRVRAGIHTIMLVVSIACMCLMGVHIATIHMNMVGHILVQDVFLGVIGPLLTPLLLKGVRRPNTTIAGTMETALPLTMLLCITFMFTSIGLGMRPYESDEELGRNIAAATTLLPLAWGLSMMYVLHCLFRRRMLYILSTFLLVFSGREYTLARSSPVVATSFWLSCLVFFLSLVASNRSALQWVMDSSSTASGGGGVMGA